MLNEIIKVSSGFQKSVNIEYDFNDAQKISGYIPTSSSLEIIENILINTEPEHYERAKILTGAYGRGKSHTVLVALSILCNKDEDLFTDLLKRVKTINKDTRKRINNYIESSNKLLPVIITGNSGSLTQSFLGALQQTLKLYGLEDIMPETHFTAALNTIDRWEAQYPKTYQKFIKKLGKSLKKFRKALVENDVAAYQEFHDLYPELTSGSEFNPFIGFNVVDIYDKVNTALKSRGYTGMYVVYDEFGKYLESNISTATDSDTKMLQDFAEKCNREASQQLHLLLICHKDISNYIDENLPQEKVNGWRGISGRFEHISISNHFHQMYEIIAYTLKHNNQKWKDFTCKHNDKFSELLQFAKNENFLSGKDELVVYGCYPLHPVTSFILPRLSERIAQNERTLFTYLSSNQKHTLKEFLKTNTEDFPIVTPDYLYDYFEQELRKELNASEIHKTYQVASRILAKVEQGSLSEQILKTVAVIYFIEQFERIAPTVDIICSIFSEQYATEEIMRTINDLVNRDYIVYIKNSNRFMCLKESSGVDVHSELSLQTEKKKMEMSMEEALNSCTHSSYLYPVRHNEEKCLTRYFDFHFISYRSYSDQKYDDDLKNGESGHVFAVFCENETEHSSLQNMKMGVNEHDVFIRQTKFKRLDDTPYRYLAAIELRDKCNPEDSVLISEYDMLIEDLETIVEQYIATYTHPELQQVSYCYLGRSYPILRRSHLTALLSKICDTLYPYTPIINNESINKDILPSVAINSRTRLIKAILESQTIAENLGLIGSGQDVSFFRSTLIKTGILHELDGVYVFDEENCEESIRHVLKTIRNFFVQTITDGEKSFGELYAKLTDYQYGIGMKKGSIPVYIAVVLHDMQQHLIFKTNGVETKLSADTLAAINMKPEAFSVLLEDWTEEKAEYIRVLSEIFSKEISSAEKQYNSFTCIVNAMVRWYLSLPKCTRMMKKNYKTEKAIPKEQLAFINSLNRSIDNPHDYLMNQLPKLVSQKDIGCAVTDSLKATKTLFDRGKDALVQRVIYDTKEVFGGSKQASLSSVLHEWYDSLSERTLENLFPNQENSILNLIKTITNDETAFAERCGKTLSGLMINDWEEKTLEKYKEALVNFKNTIDKYNAERLENIEKGNQRYKIVIVNEDGSEQVKSFEHTEYSKFANLLYQDITASIEEMGRSISEQEKRQILIEILLGLC